MLNTLAPWKVVIQSGIIHLLHQTLKRDGIPSRGFVVSKAGPTKITARSSPLNKISAGQGSKPVTHPDQCRRVTGVMRTKNPTT